jgi:hypothetical protein
MIKHVLIAAFAALAAVAYAQQPAQKSAQPAGGGKDAGAHYWYDGQIKRSLYMSGDQAADFGSAARQGKSARAADVLVPKATVAGKVASDGVSPVFSDQQAGGIRRALPGGVIVTLKSDMPEAAARTLLQSRGLTPVRHLGSDTRVWLVQTEAGMAALELANRLHESGEFESAQPNWWQPRALK